MSSLDKKSEAPPVLRGTGLVKRFGSNVLFGPLEIELRAGELVLLRGDNGAGKTTLIDILTGNQLAEAGTLEIQQGDSSYRTIDARHTDPSTMARMGVVKCWQRPELFWSHSVRDNLEIASFLDLDSAAPTLARALRANAESSSGLADVEPYLESFSLQDLVERETRALSFGQSRRVSLSLSAIVGTRALLLDEPLASLDQEGVEAVNRLLQRLVEEKKRAILVVEHALNERLLSGIEYEVLELRRSEQAGRDIELKSPEKKTLVQFERRAPEDRWTNILERGTGLRKWGPAQTLGDGATLLHFRSLSAIEVAPQLEVEGLRVRRGTWELFGFDKAERQGLSFSLYPGVVTLLLARNGWGKSSLAKAIAGELAMTAGSLRLDGEDLSQLSTWQRRRRGLLYSETGSTLFGNLSLGETLQLKGVSCRDEDWDGLSARTIRTLSGGERQRLALHCALAALDAAILILDEPFNGLDSGAVSKWMARIEEAASAKRCILICLPA